MTVCPGATRAGLTSKLMADGDAPVPFNVMITGLVPAFETMFRLALAGPVLAGSNVTEITQVPFDDTVEQVEVSAKAEVFAPAKLIELTTSAALPVFVTVIV